MADLIEIPTFSASQIDTFDHERGGCERKWGFSKIEHVRVPPNRFAQRGLDLHDVAEAFLKHGTVPPDTDAGKVFRAGLPYLPSPGMGVAEGPFKFLPNEEPFAITGRIDWRGPSVFDVDLIDHKSTSSTDFKYAKTAAVLLKDSQSVLYSVYVMTLLDMDRVRARWINYRWSPDRPKAKPVDFVMELPHVVEEFEKLKEICRRMAWRHEQKVRAKELPYNLACCDAYGGCPYRGETCGLSSAERLRAHMAQMSLKEKMALRAAQQPAVNPPPAAVPAVQPAAPMAQAALPVTVVPAAPAAQPAAPAVAAVPVAQAAPAVAAAPAVQAPAAAPAASLAEKMKAKKAREAAAAAVPETPAVVPTAAPEAPAVQASAAAPTAPAPSAGAPATLSEKMAAKKAATASAAPAAAATEYPAGKLPKEKYEDLALACEMIGHGFKAIASHFRSL